MDNVRSIKIEEGTVERGSNIMPKIGVAEPREIQ